jgi:hypothetical protein
MLNFGQIRSRVRLYLSNTANAVDQDFDTDTLNQILNDVYLQEVNRAKAEGLKSRFRATVAYTWPAGQVLGNLPATLSRRSIERIRDITNDSIGTVIVPGQDGRVSQVFWKDRSTLQWGTTGPASDRTLRFDYMAVPEALVADEDVPALIHDDYHEMLAWAAAIQARTIADESVPQVWAQKLNEFRADYWDTLSRGQPFEAVPTIKPIEASLFDAPFYVTSVTDSTEATQDGSSLSGDGSDDPAGNIL